jgi:hypothetical protein
MRRAAILLLSVSIGFPSAVGVTEVCAISSDAAWAKRLRDIANFNTLHPGYVKKHNLTRDMHRETAHNRAYIERRWKRMCYIEGAVGISLGPPYAFSIRAEQPSAGDDDAPPFRMNNPDDLEPEAKLLTGLLPDQEYPAYENPSVSIDSGLAGYPYPAGFLPGGFAPVGGGHGVPDNPPHVPIAPTPEPTTLSLLGTGLLVLAKFARRMR